MKAPETELLQAADATAELPVAYLLSLRQRGYRVIKAVADFFIALCAIALLFPLFLIVALAIKLDSRGPVFFVQKRVGRGGKLFRCVKFRTMTTDANHEVAGYEYAEVTSYITRIGRFLRKTSIDELPQLFNMLTFKMSLIGYRPSQPCETELNDARKAHNVYQLAPGISGWAQVNGRDLLAAHPTKKAEFDAYYLKHFSLLMDVKIFFLTIKTVLSSSDIAEGICTEEETKEEVMQ